MNHCRGGKEGDGSTLSGFSDYGVFEYENCSTQFNTMYTRVLRIV